MHTAMQVHARVCGRCICCVHIGTRTHGAVALVHNQQHQLLLWADAPFQVVVQRLHQQQQRQQQTWQWQQVTGARHTGLRGSQGVGARTLTGAVCHNARLRKQLRAWSPHLRRAEEDAMCRPLLMPLGRCHVEQHLDVLLLMRLRAFDAVCWCVCLAVGMDLHAL